MKTIITYFRNIFNRFMDIVCSRLWKAIPLVLLLAFLFTFADYSFLKKYLFTPEDIVHVLGGGERLKRN